MSKPPRIAARAVIVKDARLLLVNAYGGGRSDLWCAPGGGVEPHASLPDNLAREVYEETGLRIEVGAPCLVNEFHAPERQYHQIEVFFRCKIISGQLDETWQDPEQVVTARRYFSAAELEGIRLRPASLPRVAFDGGKSLLYDPLELIVG